MNSLGQIVFQTLQHARWVPPTNSSAHETRFAELAPGDDILPLIAAAWSQASGTDAELHASRQRRGRHLRQWAHQQIARGARLAVGLDPPRWDAFQRWNGIRLVWWPTGVPAGDRVGLVSSHLGRNLSHYRDWFRTLRAACARIDARRELLVSVDTVTTHDFARRAAELFDVPILRLQPPRQRQTGRAWLETLAAPERSPWRLRLGAVPSYKDAAPAGTVGSDSTETHRSHAFRSDASTSDAGPPDSAGPAPCYAAHVSPPLEVDRSAALPEFEQSPVADRLLMTVADRLLVFYLRRRGKLLPLIRRRLEDPAWRPQTTYLALGPQLVPRDIGDELLAAGAVGWVLRKESSDPRPTNILSADPDLAQRCGATSSGQARHASSRIIRSVPEDAGIYLTHCTRAAHGPWPDQAADEFISELILSEEIVDRTALATLRRILNQQQILATSNGIRGGQALVSFTAIPLGELSRYRTFRVHRGRWDFEPYGICIRSDYLRQAGARPVCYGDHDQWEALAPADRPFFQRQFSLNSKTGVSIDWSCEREWRILDHLDLSQVDDASAFVFVPSIEEAQRLQPGCRWRIVVLETR